MTRGYLAFAAFAAALGLFSTQPIERCWGTWAAIGYAAAAAVSAAAPRQRTAAVVLALAGATVAPLAWQAWAGLPSLAGEGALTVVARAGGELLRHGTPYSPAARLSGVLTYDPYEPLMAVFGWPAAAGPAGWAGNPRVPRCGTRCCSRSASPGIALRRLARCLAICLPPRDRPGNGRRWRCSPRRRWRSLAGWRCARPAPRTRRRSGWPSPWPSCSRSPPRHAGATTRTR